MIVVIIKILLFKFTFEKCDSLICLNMLICFFLDAYIKRVDRYYSRCCNARGWSIEGRNRNVNINNNVKFQDIAYVSSQQTSQQNIIFFYN